VNGERLTANGRSVRRTATAEDDDGLITSVWVTTMSFLFLLGSLLPGQCIAAPELIVDIDFNDEVYIRPEPMTEAEVEKLVRDLHAHGCQTLLVRMGYLGYLPYHTDLSYPIGFDVEHARAHGANSSAIGDLDKYIESHIAWNEKYARVLAAFNPPEVFIRIGHELGMKVVMWLDIFDDGFPGYRSKFIDEHPQCQWTAKDGQTRFEGLISYAWPEARSFRVAQATELLDLGADGIHCSTSAHCRHLPNPGGVDFYGYEDPIVAEYRQRYGVDIRTAEDFDKEAWHTIKGEAQNSLYRELAAVCHERGKELWVGLQLGDYTQMCAPLYFGDNGVARYRNLWRELVDEGIADALILGDYELCTQPGTPYWKAKGDEIGAAADLFSWAAEHYQSHCRGRTKLYTFGEWLSGNRQQVDAKLKLLADKTVGNGFDGIDVHEAMNFEGSGMDLLRRMAERLAGRDPGELE